MGKYFLQYSKSSLSKARNLRKVMTNAEGKLWSHLRRKSLGVKFRRQVPFGPYILDFFSFEEKLVIEVDGSQHYTIAGLARDKKRDRYLLEKGLTVPRFTDGEIFTNTVGVLQTIYDHVHETA